MSETIRLGGLERKFLESKESTGGSPDLFEMTVQPNARVPVPHYHQSWDETIYGLAGTTTWRVDGHDVNLERGQTVFIRRGVVHSFRNDTQEPAICLCILSPGVLGPAYFREMAELLSAGPPDPVRMGGKRDEATGLKAVLLHPAALTRRVAALDLTQRLLIADRWYQNRRAVALASGEPVTAVL